jgi:hypothetical protein
MSMVMNFFHHPAPPPMTIKSKHSDFMDLSYSDRLDLCVPYITQNVHTWVSDWQGSLGALQGLYQRQPVATPAINSPDAQGQQVVNLYLAVTDYAEKRAEANEGKNIQSCALTPRVSDGWNTIEPLIDDNTATEVPPEKWTGGYAACVAAVSDCS